jgi:hypothetical protein
MPPIPRATAKPLLTNSLTITSDSRADDRNHSHPQALSPISRATAEPLLTNSTTTKSDSNSTAHNNTRPPALSPIPPTQPILDHTSSLSLLSSLTFQNFFRKKKNQRYPKNKIKTHTLSLFAFP